MLILPNKSELYAAILRRTVFAELLKKGKSPKIYKNLLKIAIFETVTVPAFKTPTDTLFFVDNILGACLLRRIKTGRFFKSEIGLCPKLIIDRKALTLLLSLICLDCDKIYIYFKNNLFIKAENIPLTKEIKAIIRALGGQFFFETKTKSILIKISAEETKKAGSKPPTLSEYILDDFSYVNLVFYSRL